MNEIVLKEHTYSQIHNSSFTFLQLMYDNRSALYIKKDDDWDASMKAMPKEQENIYAEPFEELANYCDIDSDGYTTMDAVMKHKKLREDSFLCE